MAKYAKIINGIVDKVIVADSSFFNSYVDDSPGTWIETTTGNIGYTYDSDRSAFVPAKAYASWILNEGINQWEAPIAKPADNKDYIWDESTTNWVERE